MYTSRKLKNKLMQDLLHQPVGPIYEEVSPKEEIELNTNQAYGPVALWNF